MKSNLLNFTDTAQGLGTDPRTISGLVKSLGITPKPMGLPGKSQGLDPADRRLLRRALNLGRKSAAAPAR